MPRRRDSRERLAARVPCRTSPAFARQTQARQTAADDDISLEANILDGFAIIGFPQHHRRRVAGQLGGRKRACATNRAMLLSIASHASRRIVMKILCTLTASASLLALSTFSVAAQSAKATLKDKDSKDVGSATLTQTPGGVLIALSVKGLPAGEHAFHVHGIGKCEPPFMSAGGHFNPDKKKHGMLAPDGSHAGDMPNLHIPASGELAVEVLNTAVTLEKGKANSLFGPEGTALIIHASKDDYKTDPTGEAGGRIACGLVE